MEKNNNEEYEKLFRQMNDINDKQFVKQKEYEEYKTIFLIFLTISVIQVVPFGFIWFLISAINTVCGGTTCDGNECVGCTPSVAPVFFVFLFLWMAEIIVCVVFTIKYAVKMNKNKKGE